LIFIIRFEAELQVEIIGFTGNPKRRSGGKRAGQGDGAFKIGHSPISQIYRAGGEVDELKRLIRFTGEIGIVVDGVD
jgi:hypothetical protein